MNGYVGRVRYIIIIFGRGGEGWGVGGLGGAAAGHKFRGMSPELHGGNWGGLVSCYEVETGFCVFNTIYLSALLCRWLFFPRSFCRRGGRVLGSYVYGF